MIKQEKVEKPGKGSDGSNKKRKSHSQETNNNNSDKDCLRGDSPTSITVFSRYLQHMMNICKEQTPDQFEKLSDKINEAFKEDCKCKSLHPI